MGLSIYFYTHKKSDEIPKESISEVLGGFAYEIEGTNRAIESAKMREIAFFKDIPWLVERLYKLDEDDKYVEVSIEDIKDVFNTVLDTAYKLLSSNELDFDEKDLTNELVGIRFQFMDILKNFKEDDVITMYCYW